jgi:hypothetical protein
MDADDLGDQVTWPGQQAEPGDQAPVLGGEYERPWIHGIA